jgi:hypothetical protein
MERRRTEGRSRTIKKGPLARFRRPSLEDGWAMYRYPADLRTAGQGASSGGNLLGGVSSGTPWPAKCRRRGVRDCVGCQATNAIGTNVFAPLHQKPGGKPRVLSPFHSYCIFIITTFSDQMALPLDQPRSPSPDSSSPSVAHSRTSLLHKTRRKTCRCMSSGAYDPSIEETVPKSSASRYFTGRSSP